MFLHGGGFCLGTLDQFDVRCCETARSAGCVVAAAGYRLAPKCKFPTAPEDCYAALEWLVANPAALGIDPQRVSSVVRARAGILWRVFQVLEVPLTDLTLSFPRATS